LWFALGNCEIGRDVTLKADFLIADARTKLPGAAGMPSRWPSVVVSAPETIALVDRRWKEYGLGVLAQGRSDKPETSSGEHLNDCPASPSLRYRRLLRSDEAFVIAALEPQSQKDCHAIAEIAGQVRNDKDDNGSSPSRE